MKKLILFSLVVITLSFTNCAKPEEGGNVTPPPTPIPTQEQITIPPTVNVTPVVPPEGGDAKITFTATAPWTASVISTKADSWVDVNPKSGNSGSAEIKITTTPNDTYVERNATILIKCGEQTKDIVLTQKQVDNITVTTDKVELGAKGGSFTIELKSNVNFSYEIDGNWIKSVSTKAYTEKALSFTAEPNNGVQKREGSVTVKGGGFSEMVKVYQSGEEPTLIISQNKYNLEAEGGSIAVEVSSNVSVTMTIPEDADWITENKTKSVSTNTFYLNVASNKTNKARSTEITFLNEESSLSEKITVTQKGGANIPVPEMVDLGLSVNWANCNLGATSPDEYGGYYQWGGLQDVTSKSIYLEWSNCPYHTGSSSSKGWTKYIPANMPSYWSGMYSPDGWPFLVPEDDVVHVNLGGKWRMPTQAEWEELIDNCTWKWTKYNGVNGYKVTSKMSGYSDKWIFLPAAGYRDNGGIYTAGENFDYWSLSLSNGNPSNAICLKDRSVKNSNYRYYGQSVRPVYGDDVVMVHGVKLSKDSLTMAEGDTQTLTAILIPTNATNRNVTWSSSSNVASVDKSGNVTARRAGTATITVGITEGGRSYIAQCIVTVTFSIPEMVDLGLSVKWASCNLGASKPENYSGYYQWGGLQDVSGQNPIFYPSFSNCPYHTGSSSSKGWTKYVQSNESSYWSGSGSPDNKTVLDPEDDVAHVNLGGKWRMPMEAEWKELIDNCTWKWTTQNGVNGYKVTSKKPGYTSKSIFLPARSYCGSDGWRPDGGYYWSSSLHTSDPTCAYCLHFNSSNVDRDGMHRYLGFSVRPVYGDRVIVTGISLTCIIHSRHALSSQ